MISIALPDDIKEIIYSVINSAVKAVDVSKVYLFGSYYNGTYTEDSDIDLAFFVHNDVCLLEAHRKIIKITSRYPIDIQPQIFHENEMQEKIGIVGEIIENGGEIYTGNTE